MTEVPQIRDVRLSDIWRGKARPGESGEVAIRMLFEVGLELLAPIAVLHGIPESKIESVRGGIRGRWRRRVRRRKRGRIKSCSGERGESTLGILLEIRFELRRAAVRFPKTRARGQPRGRRTVRRSPLEWKVIRVPQRSPRVSAPPAGMQQRRCGGETPGSGARCS